MEGVQHPAITGKDKRGNKTVFKTLLKTILTAFTGYGAVMPHPRGVYVVTDDYSAFVAIQSITRAK
ncbi:hypothetical protein DWS26_26900 [Escherichia coli]|nr:hypothetical protein [Escherichia coli]